MAEFARHLDDELDLMREAANASQLGRNFAGSPLLLVPGGVLGPVRAARDGDGAHAWHADLAGCTLREKGIDIPALARAGVEIFFTQVFRDGFFHADMHPGNILVADDGRYIALDFGIMGTLTEVDKNYLAQNFLAFFNRDYRRVAQAHLDAGWVPAGTRVDEFEAAIRAVCEPIFARPLKEIYFGRLLLRLFQTSRRFNVEVQPQLVMLQKTLLNIEGLGRELDPDLDLWQTAKPFLERWMREQVGWRGLVRTIRHEAPFWAATLPQLPRLVHRALAEDRLGALREALELHRRSERAAQPVACRGCGPACSACRACPGSLRRIMPRILLLVLLFALEHHVLDEMGGTEHLGRLVASPIPDPHPDRDGTTVGNLSGEQDDPRGQGRSCGKNGL